MNDTVQRIAEQAKADLKVSLEMIQDKARQAVELVLEAERSLDAVVGVARDFPEKLMTKYALAATGEIKIEEEERRVRDSGLVLDQYHYRLAGLFGSNLKRGKYRVLILLERVE